MADKDQRTEQATPKRQEKLRQDGKVAKSSDINTAAVMTASLCAFMLLGPHLISEIMDFSTASFRLNPQRGFSSSMLLARDLVLTSLSPILALLAVAAFISGSFQTRGLFTFGSMKFQLERINPLPNLKKVFPSIDTMQELIKQVVKLGLLSVVVGNLIINDWWKFAAFPMMSVHSSLAQVASILAKLIIHAGIAFVAIALVDLVWARKKFADDAKMSRQEVKDEHKQQEGDTAMRGRMRGKMRQASNRRKEADIKTATVIVTNPTHISVALRYEPGKDFAPILLAKATDENALDIRRRARALRIPIIENRSLAREVYKNVKVLDPIPSELYRATAEIIGHVLQLRRDGLL